MKWIHFLEKYKLSKQSQEKIEKIWQLYINKVEFIIYNLLTKKTPGPGKGSLEDLKEGTLPNSFLRPALSKSNDIIEKKKTTDKRPS